MEKNSKRPNLINSINEIITIAKEREIVHQFTEDHFLDGRTITLRNKQMINFGSCSYLGLETDQRLKDAGIDAIQRYGSQFSSSRTYVSFTLYEELEYLLEQMFNAPLILSTCSSLGHAAVVPIVVGDNDAVILDHQAHISMQDAARKLQLNGVPVTMLRHSRLDELETKVLELSAKHDKVWYFIDGVYSMYGDFAPLEELITLLNKHPKLWLYADDAHGMSWAGKNGTGYLLSQVQLHSKMILATSLAKGFASAGGVFVFPNQELCQRVKNWGGPLTYSGPQQPAVIGASIASAKIHLSNEIYFRQKDLAEKIQFCNDCLKEHNLPLIAETAGPIFFIGLGLTKVGYNMVRRLADDGYYVNLGIFPAVPETCTGIRFTISTNHTFADIENLVKRIAYHLPKALKEEDRTMEDIYRAFRSVAKFSKKEDSSSPIQVTSGLKVQHETSIHAIPKELWNSFHGDNGSFDWNGLAFLEQVYKKNPKKEHNWDFHYYIIKDSNDSVVVATFFTSALCKEDMFASPSQSEQIEEKRKLNPYFLTSKAYMMGSLLTEGEHLYLNKSNSHWKEALMMLLDMVWKQQDELKAELLFLRDFDTNDIELRDFFMDRGFVKMEIPATHIFDTMDWNSKEEYLAQLHSNKRNKLKKEVLNFESCFEVEFVEKATEKEIDHWYSLYENIKGKNLAINVFELPKKLFHQVTGNKDWDILQLRLKPEFDNREERLPIAVGFIYKGEQIYCPVVIGLDYNYITYNSYRQMIFCAILRAKQLNKNKIYFGLTATEEKQKFGIKPVRKVAYVQMKDNYNASLINMMPSMEKSKKEEKEKVKIIIKK